MKYRNLYLTQQENDITIEHICMFENWDKSRSMLSM